MTLTQLLGKKILVKTMNGIVAVLIVLATVNSAQAASIVDSVQPPVWVERNNERLAVSPGMELSYADKLNTGGNGKALLKFSDGSDVKLGENVALEIKTLEEEQGSIFKSFLNVLQGAFRFTTTLAGNTQQRDVQIQVGAVTMGVRGTDVWGKASSDKDFIVLIEGKIDINRYNEETVIIDKPLSFYDAPKNLAANPVKPVDLDNLKIWAQETELDYGKGVITSNGKYQVYLGSYQTESLAQDKLKKLQQLGYPVEAFFVTIEDQYWTRIGIKGFMSEDDARFFIQTAPDRLEIDYAWIGF